MKNTSAILIRSIVLILLVALVLVSAVPAAYAQVPGQEPSAAPASSERGRAQILDNTLVTDQGTLIRGAQLGVFAGYESDELEAVESLTNMKRLRDAGANAVRIYWYDAYARQQGWGGYSVDESLEHLDRLVDNASAAGMYVVINFMDVGHYDLELLKEFWTKVAPRYANRTHVMYEMVNEPVFGAVNYTDSMLQDFKAVHDIMRTAAPDTIILNLTFNSSDSDMTDIADRYARIADIDWTRDLVAFHTYGTSNTTFIQSLKEKYPVICTEFWYPGKEFVESLDGDAVHAQTMERLGISWFDWGNGKVDPGDTDIGYREHVDTVLRDARSKGYLWKRDVYDEEINAANNRKIVAASSDKGFGPDYAVDGIVDSSANRKWQAAQGANSWLSLDLGERFLIDRWTVYHAGSGGEAEQWNTRDFKLQVSTDGRVWKDVDAVVGNTANITDRTIAPVTTRYARLFIAKPAQLADGKATIYEIKLFGSVAPCAVNAAGEAAVTASSAYDVSNKPSNVVDGIIGVDDSGEWKSQGETNPWIRLEWERPQRVDRIVLFDRPDLEKAVNEGMITFSDGSSIQVSGINNDGSASEVRFAPRSIRWLKFEAKNGEGTNNGLSELQVFADRCQTPVAGTGHWADEAIAAMASTYGWPADRSPKDALNQLEALEYVSAAFHIDPILLSNGAGRSAVTREEFASYVVRGYLASTKAYLEGGDLSGYVDRTDISPAWLPYMKEAVGLGFLTGPVKGKLLPGGKVTYGEAMTILDRALTRMKKLDDEEGETTA